MKKLFSFILIASFGLPAYVHASEREKAMKTADDAVEMLFDTKYQPIHTEILMSKDDTRLYDKLKNQWIKLREQFTQEVEKLPEIQNARRVVQEETWMPDRHAFYDGKLNFWIREFERRINIIDGPHTQERLELYKPAADKAAHEIVAKYAKQKEKLETVLQEVSAEKNLTPHVNEFLEMQKQVAHDIEKDYALGMAAAQYPHAYIADETEQFQSDLVSLCEKLIDKLYEKLTNLVASDVSGESLETHADELSVLDKLITQKRSIKPKTSNRSLWDRAYETPERMDLVAQRELQDKVYKLSKQFSEKLHRHSEPTKTFAESAGGPATSKEAPVRTEAEPVRSGEAAQIEKMARLERLRAQEIAHKSSELRRAVLKWGNDRAEGLRRSLAEEFKATPYDELKKFPFQARLDVALKDVENYFQAAAVKADITVESLQDIMQSIFCNMRDITARAKANGEERLAQLTRARKEALSLGNSFVNIGVMNFVPSNTNIETASLAQLNTMVPATWQNEAISDFKRRFERMAKSHQLTLSELQDIYDHFIDRISLKISAASNRRTKRIRILSGAEA